MVGEGWAPRTLKGYSTGVRRYVSFARDHHLLPLPLSEFKLLCFVAFLDSQTLSHRTVRAYLAALRAWIIASGLPEPLIWTPRLRLALRSMDRARPPSPLPIPITFPLLHSMLSTLNSSQDHLVLASAISLQYFACLRASEFSWDPQLNSGPTRNSISFQTIQGAPVMTFTVQRSKTAPHGFRVHVGCSQHPVCAHCLLRRLLAQFPSHPQSPLFTLSSGQPLSYPTYNAFLKSLAQLIGLEPSRVSSHSLRAGAATQAAMTGFSSTEIQRLGRWRSDAYLTYTRPQPESYAQFAPRLISHSHSHLPSFQPPASRPPCTF